MTTHREKTISGFKWSAVGQIGTEASKFIVGIILARLLGPEAFGLISMVLVFTGIANIVLEFGFAEALIQRQGVTDKDWSSIFWVNLAMSILISLVLIIVAPFVADFYSEPELGPITITLSGLFIFQGLSVVQRTQLTKELEFKKLAKVDIAGFVISGSLALIAAFLGYGVWSLIIQHLSRVAIMSAMLWFQSKWRPLFIFSLDSVRQTISLSFYMFLNRFLGHIAMNIDNLVIGKVIGKKDLGYYNRAFFFMVFPVNSFTNVLTRVLFPSLASIQDEMEKLRGVFVRMIGLVSYCIYPLMAGLFVLASQLTIVVFGEEWAPMIPYLKVFALIGMLATLSRLSAIGILSVGRKDLLLKMTLFEKPITILATVVGIYWGIWGVLIAKLLISFPVVLFKVIWAGRALTLNPRSIWKPTYLPLILSVCMAGIVAVVLSVMQMIGLESNLVQLLVCIPFGIICYLAGSVFLKSQDLRTITTLMTEKNIPVPSRLKF